MNTRDFGSVSLKILIEKLMYNELDQQMARWIENWLNDQAQKVAISTKSSWRPVTSGVCWGQYWVQF